MKRLNYLVAPFLIVLAAGTGFGQEKPKTEEKPKAESQSLPIKVQIVFTEFEGDKKVKSLPYTMDLNASDSPELRLGGWAKMRIGSRVPVYVGNNQMQYIDVGTNIDARGAYSGAGHLLLQLNVERSWVEGEVSVPVTKPDTASSEPPSGHFREPIIRGFKSELELKLREGQSIESTMATDPISGKLLKVEVSFVALK